MNKATLQLCPDKRKGFQNGSFLTLFHNISISQPNNIATIDDNSLLTYSDLDNLANAVALKLKNEGIKPRSKVVVYCEASSEHVAAMMGILKAGAVYVPLDPNLPKKLLKYILEDTKPQAILIRKHSKVHFNESYKSLVIEEPTNQTALHHYENQNVEIDANDPAYVIYTSGSTGQPKGIIVSHESLSHIVFSRKNYYPKNFRGLVSGGVCFDATLLVIIYGLGIGNTLCICNDTDPKLIARFIEKHAVNYIIQVPSQYRKLLAAGCDLSCINCVSLTGEHIPTSLCNLHKEHLPKAILYNEYGPSEYAIGTTIKKILPSSTNNIEITVGEPLADTTVYILDKNNLPLDKNEIGEIYISGPGLALGYLNQQSLTDKHFIHAVIDQKPKILYRTGDFGSFVSQYELDFFGRIEQSAYLEGQPVLTGKIEKTIYTVDCIQECVVLIEEDRIVAFYTSIDGKNHTAFMQKKLKKMLSTTYMPSEFIHLDAFSLSRNGKIDRAYLVREWL